MKINSWTSAAAKTSFPYQLTFMNLRRIQAPLISAKSSSCFRIITSLRYLYPETSWKNFGCPPSGNQYYFTTDLTKAIFLVKQQLNQGLCPPGGVSQEIRTDISFCSEIQIQLTIKKKKAVIKISFRGFLILTSGDREQVFSLSRIQIRKAWEVL